MARKKKPEVEPVALEKVINESEVAPAPVIEKMDLNSRKKQASKELVEKVMEIILSIE